MPDFKRRRPKIPARPPAPPLLKGPRRGTKALARGGGAVIEWKPDMRACPLEKVVLAGGVRTPFAKAGKELRDVHPADLAAQNIRELLFRLNLSGREIGEVLLGNTITPPDTANIARAAAVRGGLPKAVSAATVHRSCASSLESIATAAAKIQAGMIETAIAGGAESMSQAPLLFNRSFQDFISRLPAARTLRQKARALCGFRLRFLKPRIGLLEGLTDPLSGLSMGETAELLAKEFGVSREEQDNFAIQSHKKALAAENRLREEIFPVFPGPERKILDRDTGPKSSISRSRVQKMRPFFDKKRGSVTIFNSCPLNDGSAVTLITTEERAAALGLKPLARLRSLSFAGLMPEKMGLGPVYAAALALRKAGLSLKDIDLVEINEAFAAQALACLKASASPRFGRENLSLAGALGEIDPSRLNVNGGAVAMGHPIAATGARLALTLAKEMSRRRAAFGLAALCVGGGQGGALILENPQKA